MEGHSAPKVDARSAPKKETYSAPRMETQNWKLNMYPLGPGLASLSASLWRIHFGISEPIMISAETI